MGTMNRQLVLIEMRRLIAEPNVAVDTTFFQAMSDLMPLHAQAHSAQTQFFQALTQATLDRNSLEAARTAHMELAEQASKRFVQLIGDVGSVLTPTQRQALATHLQKMHGMPGS